MRQNPLGLFSKNANGLIRRRPAPPPRSWPCLLKAFTGRIKTPLPWLRSPIMFCGLFTCFCSLPLPRASNVPPGPKPSLATDSLMANSEKSGRKMKECLICERASPGSRFDRNGSWPAFQFPPPIAGQRERRPGSPFGKSHAFTGTRQGERDGIKVFSIRWTKPLRSCNRHLPSDLPRAGV